jgi:putative ABC transport system permease protein
VKKFLRSLFHRSKLDADMAAEICAHLEEQTRRNLAAGMSIDDARAAAHRQFGGVAQLQERARDANGVRWLEDFLRDFTLATRVLRKRRAHTLLSIATLTLGIGLLASQFALINGVLYKGLPFDRAHEILNIRRVHTDGTIARPLVRDFLAWRNDSDQFATLGAYANRIMALSGPGLEPRRLFGAVLTSDVLPTLRVQPVLGRVFLPADDAPGAPAVVVLSDLVWRTEFGGDPAVLGRAVRIDGEPATVIGVMAPRFRFPQREDVWSNLRLDAARADQLQVIGRLHAGNSIAVAQAALDVIATILERDHPDQHAGYARTHIVRYSDTVAGPEAAPLLWIMQAMVAGVLLIACTNVANLLLAGAARRGRELAIRVALGAARGRLIAQFLTESVLLTTFGAMGGLALTVIGTSALDRALRATNAPFWFDVSIDARVLALIAGATIVAGLVAGLAPAVQASRADPNQSLNDGGHGSSALRLGRFNRLLVRIQVVVSCALLIVTGLLTKRIVVAQTTDLSFDTAGLLSGRIDLVEADFPGIEDRQQFFASLQTRLAARSDVTSVALTSRHPAESAWFAGTEIRGQDYADDNAVPRAHLEAVTAGFFSTLRVPLIEGREFAFTDTVDTEPVAVVNLSFARTYWPNESPVGKYVRQAGADHPWTRVVGVVPDLGMPGLLGTDAPRGYYVSQNQQSWSSVIVLARTRGDPMAVAGPLRAIVGGLAPDQPVATLETLAAGVAEQLNALRLVTSLCVLFGVTALVLAGVGLYGVLSFAASQRTREFAVRIALGAQGRNILGAEIGRTLPALGGSLALGALLGWLLSQPLAALLPGLSPLDATVYAGALGSVGLIALLAGFLPARRASQVDPMTALRAE